MSSDVTVGINSFLFYISIAMHTFGTKIPELASLLIENSKKKVVMYFDKSDTELCKDVKPHGWDYFPVSHC